MSVRALEIALNLEWELARVANELSYTLGLSACPHPPEIRICPCRFFRRAKLGRRRAKIQFGDLEVDLKVIRRPFPEEPERNNPSCCLLGAAIISQSGSTDRIAGHHEIRSGRRFCIFCLPDLVLEIISTAKIHGFLDTTIPAITESIVGLFMKISEFLDRVQRPETAPAKKR